MSETYDETQERFRAQEAERLQYLRSMFGDDVTVGYEPMDPNDPGRSAQIFARRRRDQEHAQRQEHDLAIVQAAADAERDEQALALAMRQGPDQVDAQTLRRAARAARAKGHGLTSAQRLAVQYRRQQGRRA